MLSYIWGGGRKTDIKENDDPELAMRENLDGHGDFATKLDGTLEFQDYLVFRSIIMRQACRAFEPLKVKMNEAKMEAYKAKEQAKYVNIFRQGQQQFNACVATYTKKACEWIEFDINNYRLTAEQA
jgi:hypothetical protein